jgi:hypothetical protein
MTAPMEAALTSPKVSARTSEVHGSSQAEEGDGDMLLVGALLWEDAAMTFAGHALGLSDSAGRQMG